MCVWLDQKNKDKEVFHREVPELSEADLTNLTHRRETEARQQRHSKTIAQVSQDADFSAEVGKGQHFVTRPSAKKTRNMDTCLAESTHYFATIQVKN